MESIAVRYEADRLIMDSQLFFEPDDGPRPAVLVFPEIFGLGEHALTRAERLADLGYIALACDIHGSRHLCSNLDEAIERVAPLRSDITRMRARARGGLDLLKSRPEVDPERIAAIGYCFGGTMALELARSGATTVATVGFHSGLSTPAPSDARNIHGKVLVCLGADDPGIPVEQRKAFEDEMRAARVDWQMTLLGGVVHSFTNPAADRLGRPDFARYDARADARSWRQMQALFDEVFA